MHKIILNKFGPISYCELDVSDFTILTGPQASGKSTIAKAIAFFRTIKNDICESIIKQNTLPQSKSVTKQVGSQIRSKFLQLFGSSRAMDNDMKMEYHYNESTFIKISLKLIEGIDYIAPKYINIDFSENIRTYLRKDFSSADKTDISKELNELFSDEYETIFIPAGRNLITLLTNQLNYVFTIMGDEQKKNIDFCTQKYIENILKIRPAFSAGFDMYLNSKNDIKNKSKIKKCMELEEQILKGKYVFENGEEKLYFNDNRFVKINYTSSGQQEIVWLINILLYQMANNIKSFVVIEEPEAHLFPNAQQIITQIISLFASTQNTVLITTHSPYILGATNNMIFASKLSEAYSKQKEVENIINKYFWIKNHNAFFVEFGKVKSCLEGNDGLIMNEVIDGASTEINQIYDALFELSED